MTHALRLSETLLATLPPAVARPAFDRATTRIGVVHLGAGAFHRAHQAVYFDDALALDPDWAVCAVSLRNPDVRDALRPQDGLYTLAILGQTPRLRVIGALREVLCARDEAAAVLARLADPAVRLVTLTVTEKGYCLAGDGLDIAHPDIVHDLAAPDAPVSAIGYLVAGLARRRAAGLAPYTVLSCDNLADNGVRLRRAVLAFAERIDPALARWIDAEAAFPRSMVDSITPATDDTLRVRVADTLGLDDAWPVQREPYAQWVVEDRFCNGRPPLERVGVTLSDDIAGFDRAKLRLLNGPHSALAYLGLLLDVETVADAMRHPGLAAFVARLMREDIAPTLTVPAAMDLDAYIDAILERFGNPAIAHRLAQIAWDGSQKLPVRLLGTIRDALAAGRPIDRLCLPIAAWMHFVCRQARAGVALIDPMADTLAQIGCAATGQVGDVARFLALREVFADVAEDPAIVDAIERGYVAICERPETEIAGWSFLR
ncbi:mannitol dehydrogenase family protein [Luteimonas sp. TWI662]|uniref:mannitol dehydrogenase family protein n=1 Tax=Luteimonas sp. TWI662 TaxID=3136789 RepID=UPI003207FEC3